MSVLIKTVPIALVGIVLLALILGGAAPTDAEPAREYVSVTVMMNANFANGRGPSSAPCLVLFDLDDPGPVGQGKVKEMRSVAKEIYSLYTGDSSSHDDAEMADFIRHVKNDSYHAHSRKAVPAALARGRSLYVSDIMLHRNKFSSDGDMQNVAMVEVTGESKGTIYQIPWNDDLLMR